MREKKFGAKKVLMPDGGNILSTDKKITGVYWMKFDVKIIYQRIIDFFQKEIVTRIRETIILAKSDIKEKNRILIITLSVLFALDYLMFCLHTEKNVFNIFPSIPPIVQTHSATLYLPSTDGASLFTEKREFPVYDSEKKFAMVLFKEVVRGSIYDNTSISVPIKPFIKKAWIFKSSGKDSTCAFDIEPAKIENDIVPIKNSEALFRKALTRTISANIPSIKRVYILENGVPLKKLW